MRPLLSWSNLLKACLCMSISLSRTRRAQSSSSESSSVMVLASSWSSLSLSSDLLLCLSYLTSSCCMVRHTSAEDGPKKRVSAPASLFAGITKTLLLSAPSPCSARALKTCVSPSISSRVKPSECRYTASSSTSSSKSREPLPSMSTICMASLIILRNGVKPSAMRHCRSSSSSSTPVPLKLNLSNVALNSPRSKAAKRSTKSTKSIVSRAAYSVTSSASSFTLSSSICE
mmetsp:Transcript_24919/g.63204  ORF Transcript_24919/g.63204 Transcript_24919/m.63204 type:complete len:230 (-) Transcript_24919:2004-2693(-)